MRYLFRLALATLLLPAALVAQRSSAPWGLVFSIARESFRGASSDTTTVPGTRVAVFPSSRLAAEIGVSRRFGAWDVALTGGYASGMLRASTDRLVLDDRTTPVKRYRGGVLVGRELASLGAATLRVMAGPVVDHWTTLGLNDRTTLGGRIGMALRLPLGPVEFENRAVFGLGQGPFNRRDLPAEASVESLRTWSVGVALRLGL